MAKKRKISKQLRKHLLSIQGGLCVYCLRPFNTSVYIRRKHITLIPVVDANIPYSYIQFGFLALSCQVCFAVKGIVSFTDIESARDYLQRWWKENVKVDKCLNCNRPAYNGNPYCSWTCKNHVNLINKWDSDIG